MIKIVTVTVVKTVIAVNVIVKNVIAKNKNIKKNLKYINKMNFEFILLIFEFTIIIAIIKLTIKKTYLIIKTDKIDHFNLNLMFLNIISIMFFLYYSFYFNFSNTERLLNFFFFLKLKPSIFRTLFSFYYSLLFLINK